MFVCLLCKKELLVKETSSKCLNCDISVKYTDDTMFKYHFLSLSISAVVNAIVAKAVLHVRSLFWKKKTLSMFLSVDC